MITLYDEEEIFRMYVESEIAEATEKATEKALKEKSIKDAEKMIKDGKLSSEDIAQYSGLFLQEVKELSQYQTV